LKFDTNFEDDILSREWHESNLESDDLKNYRNKVEYYIRKHEMDNPVILKLKTRVFFLFEEQSLLAFSFTIIV